MDLIKNIPELLQYFVPGFIFVKIISYLYGKKSMEFSMLTTWSVVVSFIIMATVKFIQGLLVPRWDLSLFVEVLIYIIVAVCLTFAVFKLSNIINKIVLLFTGQTINSNVWRDIIDYKNGTILQIYLVNSPIIYTGRLLYHNEDGEDSWFVLVDYIRTNMDTKEQFISTSAPDPSTVAINVKNIERIELSYSLKTTVLSEAELKSLGYK